MEPIIKVENLSVAYNIGKSSEFWALKDANLEIYEGEYIIIFGPSGCGKSTLLYCVAGLENPTKGRVLIDKKDISHFSLREMDHHRRLKMGIIFQSFNLISTLSIIDNITLPHIFGNTPKKERNEKAMFLLKKFGMEDLAHRFPGELSGGQQQRIAIARALIYSPSILLADEPVGNLDSKSAEITMGLLSEINKKDKKTVILVTHDPSYLYYANRVFYMKDSRITKVISNPEKPTYGFSREEERKKDTELEKLAMTYPHLKETRLRAKMILNHLLLPYGIETQEKIEETIDKYLSKEINQEEMLEILDKPPINLYVQKARNLTKQATKIAKEIEILEEKEIEITPIKEKTITLRRFLLDNYPGELSFEQVERLDLVLMKRLNGKIEKKGFEKILDLPIKKGGVGLNSRTAKKFTREVELVLINK